MQRRSDTTQNPSSSNSQQDLQSPALTQLNKQDQTVQQQMIKEQQRLLQQKSQKMQQQQTQNKGQSGTPGAPTSTPTAAKDSLAGKPYLLVSKLGDFADVYGEHIEDVLFSLDTKMAAHSGYLGMKGNPSDLRDPVKFYAENDLSLRSVADNLNSVLRRDAALKGLVTIKSVTGRRASRINKLIQKVAGPGFTTDAEDSAAEAAKSNTQGQPQGQPRQTPGQQAGIGLKLLVNGKPVDSVPDEMHLRERYQQMGGIVLLQLMLQDQRKADLTIDLEDKTAVWTENFLPSVMSVSRGLSMLHRAIEKVKADVGRGMTAASNEPMQVELTYVDDFGHVRGFNVEVKAHNGHDAVLKARKVVRTHVDRDIFQTFKGEQTRVVKAGRQEMSRLVNAFRVLFADISTGFNTWMKGELDKRKIPYSLKYDWYNILWKAAQNVSGDMDPLKNRESASDLMMKAISKDANGQDMFDRFDPTKAANFGTYFWKQMRWWAGHLRQDIQRDTDKKEKYQVGDAGDLSQFDEPGDSDPLEQLEEQGTTSFETALEQGATVEGIRERLKASDDKGRLVTIFDELMRKTTLANIAKMLGMSGPSHVSYALKKIRQIVFDYLQEAEPDSAAFNAIQQALSKKVVSK